MKYSLNISLLTQILYTGEVVQSHFCACHEGIWESGGVTPLMGTKGPFKRPECIRAEVGSKQVYIQSFKSTHSSAWH